MRRQSFLLIILVSFVSIGIGICRAASFQGLGYLSGGDCSEATAVSADGSVVVGTSCTASGVQAFRWTVAEGIVGIPLPEGLIKSWGTSVSADGQFVLGYGRKSDSPPYDNEGFRWHVSGAMDRIAAPGLNVIAKGISGDGLSAVGTSWGIGIDEEAFHWTANGGIVRLAGLHGAGIRSNAEAVSSDGLVVVGYRIYDGEPYRDCFRWAQGEIVGFSAHTANAASSDGSVVVGGLDNHETALFEAYRWTRETGITLLGTCLPNYHSRALAVSGDGSIIVGYVQNNAGYDEQKAFIWDKEHGMRLLQDVLEDDFGLDLSDWMLSEAWTSWKATSISLDGLTIAGVAQNSQGRQEAWRAVLVNVVYVDGDATGANDGSNWSNAFRCLQDGLSLANSVAKPVEIRVGEGIYRPDQGGGQTPGEKEATFQLINGVTLLGGYAGVGELDPNVRDVSEYKTVLSGDLAGNDVSVSDATDLLDEPSRDNNCYHVVTGSGTDESALLDGFTITGGNAHREYSVAYYGGGIYVSSGTPVLVHCKVEGNVAAQAGGLYVGTGGVQLIGCTFSKNAALHGGGMLNGGRETKLTDCSFLENYADTSGGASICTDATFLRCSFIRNRAGVSTGGAINNDCSAPKFDHCTFIENTAPYAGGALYNYEGDLEITDCTFSGNSSERGGAIYQGDTDTIIIGCEFTTNEAVWGGGISNEGYSDPTLTDCTFTGNVADYGGGFYNTTGSAPILNHCDFYDNEATVSGGGIGSYNNYLYSPMLVGCLLSGNTARNGGGMYNDQGDPILTDCTFRGNRAEYEGGGFFHLTGAPILTGCVFMENRADEDGGGMQNDDGSPHLIRCVFHTNVAGDEGGGMCNEDTKAPPLNPVLLYCIFVGNRASGHGGGMCNDQSSPELTNCTFNGNTGSRGGGMYNESVGAPKLINCILWSDNPEEIYDDGTATVVTYSDIKGGWEGLGNIDLDPLFADVISIDSNQWDFHLKSEAGRWDPNSESWVIDEVTSPCIDTGNPGCALGEEPGSIHNVRINMGAYGGTAEASKTPAGWGLLSDLTNDGIVNGKDYSWQAGDWLKMEEEQPGDLNRDGVINFVDLELLSEDWLEFATWYE